MTVSYTCQKPIKFWAKCKINLLYKLNQSLLCVPGCPLLLATRLRTWAPHLLPLILYFSLCVLTIPFPPLVLCPALLATIWPALRPALLPRCLWTCLTGPWKTTLPATHLSASWFHLSPLQNLLRASLRPPPSFSTGFRWSHLPFLILCTYMLLNIFVP